MSKNAGETIGAMCNINRLVNGIVDFSNKPSFYADDHTGCKHTCGKLIMNASLYCQKYI